MTTDVPYRVALVAIAIVQLGISRRYMRRANAGATIFEKRAEGLPLSIAIAGFYSAYCVAVFCYVINPLWMAGSTVTVPAGVRWTGLPIMIVGAALHIWGMHHLDRNLTISISTRDGHTLVTTGPYRWVRHPLYSGGMLESIGVCLLLANVAIALAAAGFWALIVWRTPMEEARLLDVFGEAYASYRGRVGRFLPRVVHRAECD